MARFYPYATDSKERQSLPFFFAGVAAILAYAIHRIVEVAHPEIPWFVDLPWSPVAIYGMIYGAFSRWIWRVPLLRQAGIVKIPNLNGRYEGWLTSSYDQHAERHSCRLEISQTWTSILIRGRFEKSDSSNLVTGISVEDTNQPRLTYEYWNNPKGDAVATMQSHPGTVWFDVDAADGMLKGSYYTGRGRETFGRMELERVYSDAS
jgi:hypothetical protein